jgi:hypothetical protein
LGIEFSSSVENAISRQTTSVDEVKPGKNLGWFTAFGAALSFDDPLLANFGQKHVPLRFIALPPFSICLVSLKLCFSFLFVYSTH